MDCEVTDIVPNLSRQISTIEQVQAMADEELSSMKFAHEAEIVRLEGAIDTSQSDEWSARSRRAVRALRLHNSWLHRELVKRRTAERERVRNERVAVDAAARVALAEAKRASAIARAEGQRKSIEARAARVAASNAQNQQELAIFVKVAKEVVGAEMSDYIWQLTRQRMAEVANA